MSPLSSCTQIMSSAEEGGVDQKSDFFQEGEGVEQKSDFSLQWGEGVSGKKHFFMTREIWESDIGA